MDPSQPRVTQDNDAYQGDSYSALFAIIRAKVGQWFPAAKRPFDILTVLTPSASTALLKRQNDLNHNGYPYRWIRPFAGVMGANERVVVANDPQGPWALGILSGDVPANTALITAGTHVTGVSTNNGYIGMRGIVTFSTTGTAPVAGEVVLTVTFTTALTYTPVVTVQDMNGTHAYGVSGASPTGFSILAGAAGLPASTALTIGYLAVL